MNSSEMIITCPHCGEYIIIEKLNCKIFRHAVYKKNGRQINPHMSKNDCDLLLRENKIFGCCKPFQIIIKNDEYIPIICDYI
jgi:hypothetical protein